MSFIWPPLLATLLFIPLLIVAYRRLLRSRERAAQTVGTLGMAQDGAGRVVGWRRHAPFALFLSGLALLLFSLARPQMYMDLPRIGGTVVLAFDVSASMAAKDMGTENGGTEEMDPTRMEAAKAAAAIFVENQPSTVELGVVAFSNGGVVVQSVTDQPADVLASIDRLQPSGGTSLGQGIFTSLNAIAGEPLDIGEGVVDLEAGTMDLDALQIDNFSSGVIVLLSDGENTGAPDPLAIAQVAAEAGVRIYPVGIGSREGTVLELEGFNVVTQLNEPLLQEIANLTNGTYYYAEDAETLQEIYRNIDLQLTVGGDEMEVTALVAGLSFLLLLAGGGLSMFWFGRVP